MSYVGLRNVGNELARNLPYGGQRRIEIARALAANQTLLLLDEPTAGMNPNETEDAIKKGLKRQSSVYSIGPAGENLVRFACIVGDHGHVVAHSGLGAVMGSKRLKAVVAERMQRSVKVVYPERLNKLAKSMDPRLDSEPILRRSVDDAGVSDADE